MPDSKISGLTSATTPLAGTEVLPIVQGGQTRQVSVANLTAGRGISVTTLSMSGQLTNTVATGTAPFVISSTTRVSNLNVATAGTADTLTTARNINEVSFNGSANITVPRVRAIDDRTAAPADFTTAYATVGFGSWNNNNTSPYADYIAFRTYTDATGGNDNMVSFRKDAIGMRVWQQTYGSATAFATYKDVAFTDSSITGNAATATALQNTRTLWGQNFNGTANVTGALTSVGNITGTAGVTLTATAGTLGLVATGANVITASTNGSERMRIDSVGNLGLGVTPSAWDSIFRAVQVGVANYFSFASQNSTSARGSILWNAYGTGDETFAYNKTGDNATRFTQQYDFRWYLAPSGTAGSTISFTEAMRITSAGNVGVGTSSPGFKLDVAAAGTVTARVQNTASSADAYFQAQNTVATGLFGVNATGQYMYTAQAVPLVFSNNATERMRLDSAGNLGLGVTPQTWGSNYKVFEVAGASAGVVSAYVNNLNLGTNIRHDNTNWIYTFTGQNATRYQMSANGQHTWFTAPSGTAGNTISFTQAMTLDASGNLLVGATSNPGVLNTSVVINSGASSLAGLVLQNNATGSTSTDGSHITIVGTELRIVNSENAPTLFSNNGSERMRITAAGNIHTPAGATTMTDGFFYIPAAAGAPTGAATAITGTVPLYYNSSANTLYAYNSSWQTISGGLTLVSTNANGVVYLNGSSQATTSTALQFNGDILSLGGAATAGWVTGAPILEIGNWLAFDQTTGITSTNVYYDSGTNYRYIANGAATICGADSNGFIWYHNSGGTAGASFAPTERMRLASTGELGIGQAPSSGIQVDVTSTSLTQIRARATTNGVDSRLVSDSSGLLGYTGTISNHPFAFYTNNTERARVTATGALQLSPTGGEGGELNLLNPTGGTVGGYVDVSTANNFRLWTGNLNATMQIGQLSSTGGNIQFFTEATERMRITSTGTVGIGTSTTSGAGLDVKNDAGGILVYAYGDTATAGNVSIIARNTDVGAGSVAQFGLWNDQNPFSGFNAALQYYSNASTIPNEFRIVQGASAPMTFYTNTAERLRITENGNITTNQPAQSAQNTSATLTIAQIRTRIITANAAVTLTLPTGTTLDTYATGMPTNAAFEVTFIATAAAAITIGANGNTTVGSLTVAANTSGTYRFRKTAANTFTVYRL